MKKSLLLLIIASCVATCGAMQQLRKKAFLSVMSNSVKHKSTWKLPKVEVWNDAVFEITELGVFAGTTISSVRCSYLVGKTDGFRGGIGRGNGHCGDKNYYGDYVQRFEDVPVKRGAAVLLNVLSEGIMLGFGMPIGLCSIANLLSYCAGYARGKKNINR